MRVGASAIDITPDFTVDLSGFGSGPGGREQPATGVLDPIVARAVVFAGGGKTVALVSLDLLELTRADADVLKAIVAEEIGGTAKDVCIACTHTHSAAATYPLFCCGRVSPLFVGSLEQHVRSAAKAAVQRLVPAHLTTAQAPLHIGCNRRNGMRGRDGKTRQDHPNDDVLRLLIVSDQQHRPFALVMLHACHPVCLGRDNRQISGDFPGIACRSLERRMGDGAVAMFVNGCAGDINPYDQYTGSYEKATQAAARLAAAAEDFLHSASAPTNTVNAERIECQSSIVNLEYEPPDEPGWREQLADLEAQMGGAPWQSESKLEYSKLASCAFLNEQLQLHREGRYPTHMPVVVQRLMIGPLDLLALSGEVFFEIGLRIKRLADRPCLWVAACCNGGHGYIPTGIAYDEGGYEPVRSSQVYRHPPLRPGAGEHLAEQAVRQVR